jgi:hypothetical protein
MRARAITTAVVAAACAMLSGTGCTSLSLRASEARPPILLGPVACIACAPEPARVASGPTVVGGAREREYAVSVYPAGALDRVTHDAVPLDVAATRAVPDPCREDLRVSSIRAGTWSFHLPLLFGIGNTWVDVQASRAAVPNGSCGPAPWPSSGPAGILP